MSLPSFQLIRPRTVETALESLAQYGPDVQPVAGGTDLIPSMKQGLFAPKVLLDLKALRELDFIRFDPPQGLAIGAMTRVSTIVSSRIISQQFPVLHEAAKSIASPPLRTMGTLGGNLCLDTRCLYYNQSEFWRGSLGYCLKKDGTVCHVAPGGRFCWAVFSGDMAPALLAAGATVEVAGPHRRRQVPIEDLYVNDGLVRMAKAHDEIITQVRVPIRNAGWRGAYKKLRIRGSVDYPLAGVAVAMRNGPEGVCLQARVALTAVNPAPKLVKSAELLPGRRYDPALVEEVAHQAICTAKPLRTSASTPEYRREMVRVFVRRAIEQVWLNGRTAP